MCLCDGTETDRRREQNFGRRDRGSVVRLITSKNFFWSYNFLSSESIPPDGTEQLGGQSNVT